MSRPFEDPPLLDNLIPLKGRLDGSQTAGWTPGAPVHHGLGCVVHADQMIPVADGVSLGADIYTPKKKGRYPAVVSFSAYSHQLQTTGAPTGTNETGEPAIFTDRGYNHILVSRRGMGRSQGDSVVFFNEADVADHVAVIEWCARQPWCDGNVLMFGTSYYAVVQPLTASRQPPALRGFFANGTDTDYFRQIVMFGGAPQVDFLTLWLGANFTTGQENLHVPPVFRAALSQVLNSPLKHLWEPQVHKRLNAILDKFKQHTPDLKYRKLFASWVFDGKTRRTNSIPDGPYAVLDRIQVPFVAVSDTGAFNLHQFGAYELMEKAGTAKDRKWLIMTPPEFGPPAFGWQLEALAFFDHIIHGTENGYAEQPPLRYHADGTKENEYRAASGFPIPKSKRVRFYLISGGEDADRHRLSEQTDEGTNSWGAIPFGAVVPPGLEEAANPILTFEAAPATETVEYSGPVTLSLTFSCTEIDSHVISRLSRVDAAGDHHLLSMGSIRPACRKIDETRGSATEIAIDIDSPEPLVPGIPVQLRFSMTPRPVVLHAGEKLRLDLASRTDLLRSDVSHGYEQFEMVVPPYFSRNTIHYGGESYIELSEVMPLREPTLWMQEELQP